MPEPAAKPVPIALVVCDNVYTASNGKRALVGLFSRIAVATDGPIVHNRMCIYISMTEVYPGTIAEMDIVHSETDEVLVSAETGPAPPEINPTTIFDFQFELNNVRFPEEGLYFIRFKANGHTLLQRPIEVTRISREANDDENDQAI